jgi:hypothetical protein
MYRTLFRWSWDALAEYLERAVTAKAISGHVPIIRYSNNPITVWK